MQSSVNHFAEVELDHEALDGFRGRILQLLFSEAWRIYNFKKDTGRSFREETREALEYLENLFNRKEGFYTNVAMFKSFTACQKADDNSEADLAFAQAVSLLTNRVVFAGMENFYDLLEVLYNRLKQAEKYGEASRT